MNRVLNSIFNTKKYARSIANNTPYELSQRFIKIYNSKASSLQNNKRSLIIVPGYSVDNPPRIGHHLYYINALKFDSITNPLGYHRIYLFDIYSKKDGRCNFQLDIPQLVEELMISIDTARDNWNFEENGEVDIIGASMGGLIVRKFIQEKMIGNNLLPTTKWGTLHIQNILLISTPNYGCKIIDLIQNPFIQIVLRIMFGKNNFSKSEQFQQIGVGNTSVFGKILSKIFRKKTSDNQFLKELNAQNPTPGTVRWITLRGTKSQIFSNFIYNKKIPNDGVVEADRVILNGAENICDIDLGSKTAWNHRDLYMANDVCNLLFGLLALNLQLNEYLKLLNLEEITDEKSNIITRRKLFDEYSVSSRKPVAIINEKI